MATLTGQNNVSSLPCEQEHLLSWCPHPRVDHSIGGWRNGQDQHQRAPRTSLQSTGDSLVHLFSWTVMWHMLEGLALRLVEVAQVCNVWWRAAHYRSEQLRSPGLHRDYSNSLISLNPAFLQHIWYCYKEKGVSSAGAHLPFSANEKELRIIPFVELGWMVCDWHHWSFC